MSIESDYYTVTLDYTATGEGHTRAILIQYAFNENAAREHFGRIHDTYFAQCATVVKGIHIENGFQDLVTDYAKKVILKVKSKNPDAPPMFSYSNSIYVNYS